MQYEEAYRDGKGKTRQWLENDLRRGESPQELSARYFAEIMGEIEHDREMLQENPEHEEWQKTLAFHQGCLSVLD